MHHLKKIFNISIAIGILLIVYIYASNALERNRIFPDELQISNLIYQQIVSHSFGPGGINHSFNIYSISPTVESNIEKYGLDFLNNMPSAINHPFEKERATHNSPEPYFASFRSWKQLPIPKDKFWIRKTWSFDKEIPQATISDFYGDVGFKDRFTNKIDKVEIDLLHEIIHSNEGYYSYGGYRDKSVLIVSIKHKRIYYLFRD